MKHIDKYYGPLKIVKSTKSKEKSYLGKDKMEVEFSNGDIKTIPLEILESGLTSKISDLTALREAITTDTVLKIITLLLETELPLEDVEYMYSQRVPLSINDSLKRASEKLWNKDMSKRTLMDVERILVDGKSKQKSTSKV